MKRMGDSLNESTHATMLLWLLNSHLIQWLNYSKVGGGTLNFFPCFPNPSFTQSSPLLFPPFPSISLEVGPLPARGSGRAL